MKKYCSLPSNIHSPDRHNNIEFHDQWCIQQYQNGTNSLVRNIKQNMDVIHKILDYIYLGVMNDDELSGLFKQASNPNFFPQPLYNNSRSIYDEPLPLLNVYRTNILQLPFHQDKHMIQIHPCLKTLYPHKFLVLSVSRTKQAIPQTTQYQSN